MRNKEEKLSTRRDKEERMLPMKNMKISVKVYEDIKAIRDEMTNARGTSTSFSEAMRILVECYRKHGEN